MHRFLTSLFLLALLCGLFFGLGPFLSPLSAQQELPPPRIEVFEVAPGEQASVTLPPGIGSYYILERSPDLNAPWTSVELKLGAEVSVALTHQLQDDMPRMFYRATAVSNDDPRDTDGDGIHDFYELLNRRLLNPLDGADAALDPDDNGQSYLEEFQNLQNTSTTLTISPADGEAGVATTRETVVRLSQPLMPGTVVSADDFYAEFAGEKIPARIHLNDARDSITLFYEDYLPPNALIQVRLNGDALMDPLTRGVDADDDGQPGGMGEFEFTTLTVTTLPGTAVVGRVFDSQLVNPMMGGDPVNCPLANVKITVDGAEDTLFTFTDSMGNFRLDPAPVGRFFVHIDGRTSTSEANGGYYPFVGKAWESRPGSETNIGDVYLPLVAAGTLTETSVTSETMITFPSSVTDEVPELAGTQLMVPPGSLLSENGARGGQVGIAPVDPARLPGELPEDLKFPLIITVQTNGPTNFDEPVPVRFPNLPDPETGERLPPGAKTGLWSFDHDKGRFEVVGSMTISSDGLWAVSDPGVGILAPGWHGVNGGASGGGGGDGGSGDGNGGGCPSAGSPPMCPPPCTGDGSDGNGSGGSSGNGDGNGTDPIRLFNGEMVLSETDLRIKGRGYDFTWVRTYSSKNGNQTEQGNNWQYNYNFKLEQSGRIIKATEGHVETKCFQKDERGDYIRREYFAKLEEKDDGSCTMVNGDQSLISYNSMSAGNPDDGKMCEYKDRNGNTTKFEYDSAGRLTIITDTLGRKINVAYNNDGFIESVTDFTGRQVRYEYYQDGDEGGSFGDLKSVTRPAVTDTPNGNDFPNGKTQIYTYTKGFRNEKKNHNLTSITDGRRNDPNDSTFGDGPYVVNEYSTTADESDPLFDRVVRQIWGGGTIDLSYQIFRPEDSSAGAATITTVNDRNGNVCDWTYNSYNQLISRKNYTGRAIADQPTTLTENRPANKLREEDPDFFETRWAFNEDSQISKVVYPNGNFVENTYESDLNPDADATVRGNLRFRIRDAGSHTPVGDQGAIMEEFEYLSEFGCTSCGTNFVSRHLDGRGNETLSEFDANGNVTQRTHRIGTIVENFTYNELGQMTSHTHPDNGSGHRRRDEYTYYPDTTYLATQVIDATGFAYTTTHEYDALGRKTRTIDPRGFDKLYTYNQLDQVVQSFSHEVEKVAEGETAIRYETRTFYDANNNVIRRDIQNRGEDGVIVAANPWFTTTYDYEILNEVIRSTQEVDPEKNIVMEYGYDANRNQTLIRYGEATNGTQPANTLTRSYDERNLVFQEIRAAEHPDQSTRQYDYDANQNLIAQTHGLEAGGHTTRFEYDGYNRRVSKTDPMGNVCLYSYDENSNMTRDLCLGELEDVEGSENNIRLADVTYTFDAMDRRTVENRAHFKHDEDGNEVTIADGQGTTTTVWSDFSRMLTTTNDNNHSTNYAYDTANRLLRTTDAKNNTVAYTYDGNSNRVSMLETDKSDLGNPDQQFTTTFIFDGLNRLKATIDNIGNTTRVFYDSRSNRVSTVDAKGNRIEYRYDGLNRLLETDRFMTDTGDGTGTVNDHITTRQYWDDSSRLVGQEDDNGNRTSYEFDPLNRKVADVYADATRWIYQYDQYDTEVRRRDANGSVVLCEYDLNDRVTHKDVTVGPGVSDDTTFEIYKYDGLNRLIHGQDDDSLVVRAFDSHSNVLQDIQDDTIVAAVFDAVGNQTELHYPSGSIVTTSYDELERKDVISDADGMVADYAYVGPSRIERRDNSNGTRCDYTYNGITGIPNIEEDFGVKRMTRSRHYRISDDIVIDDRAYQWDQVGNKIQWAEIGAVGSGKIKELSYDSAYRMINSQSTPAGESGIRKAYTHDGVGNRIQIATEQKLRIYSLSASQPTPADFQVNQYTKTPAGDFHYDENGNQIKRTNPETSDIVSYYYDFKNRLIEVNKTNNTQLHKYDFLNRRIGRNETTFLYGSSEVLEEVDASSNTEKIYVLGVGVDQVINWKSGGSVYFYHRSHIGNVVAISDAGGESREKYTYTDYGIPHAQSSLGNEYYFQNRRLDDEGLNYFRNRFYGAECGRFISRDPIGIWGDIHSLGNPYTFSGNSPLTYKDPLGLSCSPGDMQFRFDQCVKICGFIGSLEIRGERYECRITQRCVCDYDCEGNETGCYWEDSLLEPEPIGSGGGHQDSCNPYRF